MRELKYSVMDVFAERALEGNPLAVFHDARGVSDAEMQKIAREMSFSETTFVLPEDDESQGVRVRIFTMQEELPFAGHPTLGTASWLRQSYAPTRGADVVTLRLKAGPITVEFAKDDGAGAVGTMTQNDPVFGATFDRAEVAQVIGLREEDLSAEFRPQSVSTGNAFCIVVLQSVEVLQRLAIPAKSSAVWLSERGVRWFYCIAAKDREQAVWRARMQFYGGEDPATGSAAGCCIAYMVQHGLVHAKQECVLEQGIEILRPSRIVATANIVDAKVCEVRVMGRTIPVAAGVLFVP
ncbi:MAG: PhzF family phenazine biosynthesis protein [Bryocella sp.]